MAQAPFEVGSSVRVKEGVEDADDLDWKIEGGQGRVAEVTRSDHPTILVTWDSITLQSMPASAIEHCEQEGLDWTQYHLLPDDLERAAPRDTEEEARRTRNKLRDLYGWMSLGEEGRRIQQVLKSTTPGDERDALRAWETYLEEELVFPFDAVIAEPQEHSLLRQGDRVRVEGAEMLDSLYGLIAEVRHKRRVRHLPLADLEASGEGSPHHAPLRAYRVWFANR